MEPERPVQTTLAFHASRIVTDVGVLLAMAAMSRPFITSNVGNRSALDADALPALILLLPIFVVTLIPDHTRPLHPALGWSSLALGLAALPYALVKMLDAGILADTLDGSVGLGARLLVVGCVVSVIGIGIGLVRSLQGLPSGGTPGRSVAYQTRRRETESAKSAATPAAVTESPDEPSPVDPVGETDSPAPAAEPITTTVTESPDEPSPADPVGETDSPAPAAKPDTTVDVIPPVPTEPPPRSPVQPEIVFPDTGAVAREAQPDPVSPDDPSTTAERADAALEDHLDSLFDADDETPGSSET